jgi:transcriptional regulator with XRE-family HTH domain
MDSDLGARVKALRRERGLSQGKLARIAGLNDTHISRIENNERPGVQAIAVARIARALDTSADYLLGLSNDPTPSSAPPIEIDPVRLRHLQRLVEHLTQLPLDRRDRVIDAMLLLVDLTQEETDVTAEEQVKEAENARGFRPRRQAAF